MNLHRLKEKEGAVLGFLEINCQGLDAGVQHKDLARWLGLDPRKEREAVSNLVVNYGRPVGTSQRHGVFLCNSPQDFNEAIGTLLDINRTTNQRIKVLIGLREKLLKSMKWTKGTVVQGDLFAHQEEAAWLESAAQFQSTPPHEGRRSASS